MIFRCKNKFTGKVHHRMHLPGVDKRIWHVQEVPVKEVKPVRFETSLCKLFNAYFGFNLLRHPVYSLKDVVGLYI